MRVSVVIPSLNSPMIDRTIASLKAQTFQGDLEIIVVGLDNYGLIDDQGVCFISTHTPVGPAVARNQGVDAAQGEIICFIDSDCEAAPDWIERLLERRRQGWAVVGGAVDFPAHPYWAVCDNVVAFRHFMRLSPAGERRYVPTISFCTAKQILLRAGKFNENFPYPAGEDVDLCMRISRLGHRIYFEPSAVVYHYHRRLRAGDSWVRFVRYGTAWAQIRIEHKAQWRTYAAVFECLRKWPWAMVVLGPFIAAFNIVHDLWQSPLVFLKYWYTLPAFILSNMAWIWGATRHLMSPRQGIKANG